MTAWVVAALTKLSFLLKQVWFSSLDSGSCSQMSRITRTGTLAPTEMLRLLSSCHVCGIIMRQIVNRSWTGRVHSENHPSCVSGGRNLQSCRLLFSLSSIITDWHLQGCWCGRMLDALSSDVQTRGCMRRGHVSAIDSIRAANWSEMT